ncbi:hypothetical protein N864_02830 [Intrasporangium chromatireducens Q5-1]|uniref:Uncharacterized protein n=1 Tax=Intrasporangium chromatireducens Q5-1 TaxID=584657 RepID=W9GP97_9MICO|nr:hypothetical protein [Intrasporangium chromatireducens]EWT05714.1 hypothetical protein N864_02830 [Intrasporangium chromatireducens Q5-1]
MAHPTRGIRSSTHEILKVSKVDETNLELTLRIASRAAPKVVTLYVPQSEAARQMLRAIAASITVSPTADRDSQWDSAATVLNNVASAQVMLTELLDAGFTDFGDRTWTSPGCVRSTGRCRPGRSARRSTSSPGCCVPSTRTAAPCPSP